MGGALSDPVLAAFDQVKDVEGTIPASIGHLPNLEQLYLFSNTMRGTIPPEIGRLEKLTHLSLGENKLGGKIPASIGDLSALRYLYLNGNQLRGSIPEEIGRLTNLQHLALWGNQLTGQIPDMFGGLTELEFVWLNTNWLTGTIPPSVAALQKVTPSIFMLSYSACNRADAFHARAKQLLIRAAAPHIAHSRCCTPCLRPETKKPSMLLTPAMCTCWSPLTRPRTAEIPVRVWKCQLDGHRAGGTGSPSPAGGPLSRVDQSHRHALLRLREDGLAQKGRLSACACACV